MNGGTVNAVPQVINTGYAVQGGHAAELTGSYNLVNRTNQVTAGGIVSTTIRNFGGLVVLATEPTGVTDDPTLNLASIVFGVSGGGTLTVTFNPPPAYVGSIDWLVTYTSLEN